MYGGVLLEKRRWYLGKFSSSLLIFLLFLGFIYAEEVCKFGYKGKPETFHNGTMTVPDEMVALSDFQYVPGATDMANDTLYQPSIMFAMPAAAIASRAIGSCASK